MKISATEISVRNGEKVIKEVTKAVRTGDVEIDFASVAQIDSTALAVILAAKRVLPEGKSLSLKNQPVQLDSLIQAYGVQSLF